MQYCYLFLKKHINAPSGIIKKHFNVWPKSTNEAKKKYLLNGDIDIREHINAQCSIIKKYFIFSPKSTNEANKSICLTVKKNHCFDNIPLIVAIF